MLWLEGHSLDRRRSVMPSTSDSSPIKGDTAPFVLAHQVLNGGSPAITTISQGNSEDFSASVVITASWAGVLNNRNYMRLRRLISDAHQRMLTETLSRLELGPDA